MSHREHHHHTTGLPKKKLHQDWRVIVAVILMLVSMVIYVVTLDESVVPGPVPGDQPPVPAATP
jgi:hypothetical protein